MNADQIIAAAEKFKKENPNPDFRRAWFHPEDLKHIESLQTFSDKITSVCGIPIITSPLIERGTFFFTEDLIDEEVLEFHKRMTEIEKQLEKDEYGLYIHAHNYPEIRKSFH